MKRIYHIVLVAAALLLAASCDKKPEMSPEVLDTDEYCLEVNGRKMVSLLPAEAQLGYNTSKCQFRVSNDDMTQYFILECNKVPSKKDETLNVNLSWTLDETVQQRSGLKMVVSKIDDDGRVWLWSSKDDIAAIIRVL